MIFKRLEKTEAIDWEGLYRCIIILHYVPTWIGKLFSMKPHQEKYIGECTVWHTFPRFNGCDSFQEGFLYNIWVRERYYKEQEEKDNRSKRVEELENLRKD